MAVNHYGRHVYPADKLQPLLQQPGESGPELLVTSI